MKLYHISRTVAHNEYDVYDSAVVVAKSPRAAALTHPADGSDIRSDSSGAWTSDPAKVSVKFIGRAAKSAKPGVILASFNAA